MLEERRTRLQVLDLQVEHVRVVLAMFRNERQLDQALVGQRLQAFAVSVPASHAVVVNFVGTFQFRIKISGIEFARQVAGAKFYPCVLVDFATVELAAVRAFFTDDFGTVAILLVVDEQRSALAHAIVLGFVIAVATKVTERSERLALVGRHHALRGVFHHEQIVALCNLVDLVHLASHARIVHRHNRLRLLGDGGFNQVLVQVHGVGTDIHEHALGPLRHECIGRTHERERWHNHLVARLDVAKAGRHFKRMGAAGSHQRFHSAGMLFKPIVAHQVVSAIATNTATFDGLFHIIEFEPHKWRFIEWNLHNAENIYFSGVKKIYCLHHEF